MYPGIEQENILDIKQMCYRKIDLTRLFRVQWSTIAYGIKEGKFPAPDITLSARDVLWRKETIDKLIESIYRKIDLIRLLNISESTLNKCIREGKIPAPVVISRTFTYWPKKMFDQWIGKKEKSQTVNNLPGEDKQKEIGSPSVDQLTLIDAEDSNNNTSVEVNTNHALPESIMSFGEEVQFGKFSQNDMPDLLWKYSSAISDDMNISREAAWGISISTLACIATQNAMVKYNDQVEQLNVFPLNIFPSRDSGEHLGTRLEGRFIYIINEGKVRCRELTQLEIDRGIMDLWAKRLIYIAKIRPQSIRDKSLILLSEYSNTLYKKYSNDMQKATIEGGRFENFPEWANHAVSNCVKIAALYHCIVETKLLDKSTSFIHDSTMSTAINTMRRLESHALGVYQSSLLGKNYIVHGKKNKIDLSPLQKMVFNAVIALNRETFLSRDIANYLGDLSKSALTSVGMILKSLHKLFNKNMLLICVYDKTPKVYKANLDLFKKIKKENGY